jgi:hypothetical protein
MSLAAFDSLPWDNICYAAVTICCVAIIFKHCFETVEKIATLVILLLAAVGATASYHYIQEHGWAASVRLLQNLILQPRKEQQPAPAPAPVEHALSYTGFTTLWDALRAHLE